MVKEPAKFILPSSIKDVIFRYYRKFLDWISPIASYSQITSQIYYILFSRAFAREQRATLYGKVKYRENISNQSGDEKSTLLRRNTHRLEKGILMRPRRDVFALGYVEETVEEYCRRLQILEDSSQSPNTGELLWARDVLETYFRVVEDHPVIKRARRVFQKANEKSNIHNKVEKEDGRRAELRSPYFRDIDYTPVDYNALRELTIKRRSVRWFTEESVSRETIDRAISIALQAPSACNRQPFEFRIYDNPELVREIARLPGGTKGYAHNIPVIVVLVGRLRAYFDERDRHVIYIDASLAAMNFMLALETLGLSSCPINWPDVEQREKAMQETLNLEPDERPVMLLAVGHPDSDGMVAYSQKKDLSRIRSYNKQ